MRKQRMEKKPKHTCNNGNGVQQSSYKTHDNNNNSLKAFIEIHIYGVVVAVTTARAALAPAIIG